MENEAELEALERELPVLTRLRRFSLALEQFTWFDMLGEAVSVEQRGLCHSYLDALGFPDAEIAILVDWDDAAAAAETQDWASPSWEAEELARADLTGTALEIMSDDALKLGLNVVAERAAEAAKEGMEQAMAIWDTPEEPSLQNLAVGSAVQACHNAGLALLAAAVNPEIDAEDHIFAHKLRLFQMGRWPVGVIGNSFNIF